MHHDNEYSTCFRNTSIPILHVVKTLQTVIWGRNFECFRVYKKFWYQTQNFISSNFEIPQCISSLITWRPYQCCHSVWWRELKKTASVNWSVVRRGLILNYVLSDYNFMTCTGRPSVTPQLFVRATCYWFVGSKCTTKEGSIFIIILGSLMKIFQFVQVRK